MANQNGKKTDVWAERRLKRKLIREMLYGKKAPVRRAKTRSEFASMLCRARAKNALTQKEVTELTGIAQSKLSRFENDYQLPCRRNLEKLINCYRIVNREDIIEEWLNEKERLLHFSAK